MPVSLAIAHPVTGCTTTAVAVNSVSAITTVRAVCAIAAGLPLRCAISMKKAMPSPVPNSTVAPRMWASLSAR